MTDVLGVIGRAAHAALSGGALANAASAATALNQYGGRFGLLAPHRLAQYLAQLMHESGEFRYDKEVWGPTPAQAKYDTRADLGNTTAADGDGFLFRGRSGIQVTGKANYATFRDWCRKYINTGAPDFVAMPDAVLTDPWEGLAPVWFWSTHNLNSYADRGDNEMICRKINGGTNGLADRLDLYTRVALVLLGFKPTEIRGFQSAANGDGVYTGAIDGIDGPKTRAALHHALLALSAPPVIDAAPPVAVPAATTAPTTPVSTKNAAITAGAVVAAGTVYTWWDWLTGWFS